MWPSTSRDAVPIPPAKSKQVIPVPEPTRALGDVRPGVRERRASTSSTVTVRESAMSESSHSPTTGITVFVGPAAGGQHRGVVDGPDGVRPAQLDRASR